MPGMLLSRLRHGRSMAPPDSPLTLQDVMSRADYRDLQTAKVAVGDVAPDFELARVDRNGTVRLRSRLDELPGAPNFGTYT